MTGLTSLTGLGLTPLLTGVEVTFWVCAVAAIAGAIGVVTSSKPVYSALSLALVMLALAVIYASLEAGFLFAVQIIVYTGAVLMLFLFVIMLVGVSSREALVDTLRGHRLAACLAGVGLVVLLALAVGQAVTAPAVGLADATAVAGGNVEGLAQLVFHRYVVAFEATAALLITAAVAAMVLAHPKRLKPKPDQSLRLRRRVEAYAEQGVHPGAKPSSGVFARHNSVATPALLPDGSVAPESISDTVASRVQVADPSQLALPLAQTLAAIEGRPGSGPVDSEDSDDSDDDLAEDLVDDPAEDAAEDPRPGPAEDSAEDLTDGSAEDPATPASPTVPDPPLTPDSPLSPDPAGPDQEGGSDD
ncbi:MAG: NADH-quinone oxidoreductase subunit J [Propionibacteriaceae bacterium]|jgi:NADH-quinone oxidoreductase subunit J|nr:NADH-quinone oxidoreductase subunit J [Propionibacteriaceae bacterium]